MAQIKLYQLTQDFYNEHGHLVEVADKKNKDGTIHDKGRGYGVLMLKVKGYKFAIPLRSKMRHKENFTTKIYTEAGVKLRKGLDYSKAVIITDERFVSTSVFKIEQDEFLKIAKSEIHIIRSFEKYVERYVAAYNAGDSNILRKYGYSTLKNYLQELGCNVSKQENPV
nr:hypothetical protein [Bacillus thuringiensis]